MSLRSKSFRCYPTANRIDRSDENKPIGDNELVGNGGGQSSTPGNCDDPIRMFPVKNLLKVLVYIDLHSLHLGERDGKYIITKILVTGGSRERIPGNAGLSVARAGEVMLTLLAALPAQESAAGSPNIKDAGQKRLC